MDKLAEKLAYYIAKERVIRKDELEVYKYEFQVALELSTCIVICMVLSVWAQAFPAFMEWKKQREKSTSKTGWQ